MRGHNGVPESTQCGTMGKTFPKILLDTFGTFDYDGIRYGTRGHGMAKVGYARVSSEGQNLDRQADALNAARVEKVYSDKLSGKDTKRPGLASMLEYVREGDVVVVASFDRLARSLPDLLAIVEKLRDKGVALMSLKEAVDTSTPAGKFQLAIFGAMAEFERAIIGERREEGIEAARRRGKQFGRPRVEVPAGFDKAVAKWKRGEASAVATYKALGLSKTRFYAMVKERERKPRKA